MGNRSTLCNKQYAVNKYVGTAYDTVKVVSDNIEDVKTVADALGDDFPEGGFGTIVENIDEVITVSENIDDVKTTADNILEIVEVADNIDAVLDAPNQAELARKWAQEAEDVEVLPNEYSAYHYSKKSEEQADRAEAEVDTLANAIRGEGYFSPAGGVYPAPPTLSLPYSWFAEDSGSVGITFWKEGEMLQYVPNQADPENVLGDYFRVGGVNSGASAPLNQPRQFGDGVTTTFAAPDPDGIQYPAEVFHVFFDGLRQLAGTDYTITGAGVIEFTEAPPLLAAVDVTLFAPNYLADDVSDGLVTATGSTTPRLLADRFADVVNVKDFGAVGDALISRARPLYHAINGVGNITNPYATDDTEAIKKAIESGFNITFDGSKGYLVSEIFQFNKSNIRLKGNGAVIVYRGGRTLTEENTPHGIFSPVGTVDTTTSVAYPVEDVETFSDRVVVATDTNTLNVGDWFLFRGYNGESPTGGAISKYAYYPSQVVTLDDLGNNKTSIQMTYKAGYSFLSSEVTLGKFEPVDNVEISGFRLIDEMVATPTPDILPVPQAPEAERKEAVGLVYARNVTNCNIYDMQSYNGLYSCVTMYSTSNCTANRVSSFKPRWFGGGEGYTVRATTSCYLNTTSLSMVGGRHVIDWTTCGWCNHDGAHGSTDQVSFSLHTQCEHDIVLSNITGGDFYMANSAFGNVTTRITLDNCNFQKVRLNCLHLTVKNSQLNDFTATCGKASISNTNITEFKSFNREGRSGYQEALSYAQYGKLTIDVNCNITRSVDYSLGTTLRDWFYVDLANRWTSEVGDPYPNLVLNNCVNVRLRGNLRETLVLLTGACLNINTESLEGTWSDNSSARNFIGINAMNVTSSNIQRWRLTNMDLTLQPNCRPFQIVGRADSLQTYKTIVVVGGNTFTNCNQAAVTDKAANNMLEILSVSTTRDAYNNGLETQVECKNDGARYSAGDVSPDAGTGGIPAVWDGSSWVDL